MEMKLLKRVVVVCLVFMMLVSALPGEVDAVQTLALNKTEATMLKGQTLQLKLNTKGRVKWLTSNKKIATVSKAGRVTAKQKGKAVIIAMVGKEKLKCAITINNKSCAVIANIIKDAGLITGTRYIPTYSLVGAEDGIKYVSSNGTNIEIYKFNKSSSVYQNIVKTKKMKILGFGTTLKIAAVKDGYVLYLNGFNKTEQKKIVTLFKKI